MKKLLVTGSSGLISSEVCIHFAQLGWQIHGVDNNQRAVFFGPQGDTRWNQGRLAEKLGSAFIHHELDIRNRQRVLELLREVKPDAIVHTAVQVFSAMARPQVRVIITRNKEDYRYSPLPVQTPEEFLARLEQT